VLEAVCMLARRRAAPGPGTPEAVL